ncbi:MAG: UDP-N-acetylmuramate--L-alanine ligase [Candidatus Omnitrophota bacterium]
MRRFNKVHFIGIGGIGMSGLAEVFHCHGYEVQGSDLKESKVTDRLKAMGIDVKKGHRAENIDGADLVVYSSSIPEKNPEFSQAKAKGVNIMRRIEALNILAEGRDVIAVSGTHGKTTTTSLVSLLLIEAGLDPAVFIGADVHFLEGNARYGRGNLLVTEADESDGSFLLLDPLYSVSTNIDKEHMDYYVTMDKVIDAYRRFIRNTKYNGCAFVCADDERLKSVSVSPNGRMLRYGLASDADIRAGNVRLFGMNGSEFDVHLKGKKLGRVSLSIPGIHNAVNSLAAIGIALDLGLEFDFIKEKIVSFRGADRRFNVTRLESDVLMIDDYAHHPTEIRATLMAMNSSGKRIVTVFQPHRYSRTKYLREQFGRCFDMADHLVITDIYSADENPLDGVSARDICDSAKECGHKNVHFIRKDDIIKHLTSVIRPGDALFILGAGDIGELPGKIIKVFNDTAK